MAGLFDDLISSPTGLFDDLFEDDSKRDLPDDVKPSKAGGGRGSINPALASDKMGNLMQDAERGEQTEIEKQNSSTRWIAERIKELEPINPGKSLDELSNLAADEFKRNKGKSNLPVDRVKQYTDKGYEEDNAELNAKFDSDFQNKRNKEFAAKPADERGDKISIGYNPNSESERVAREEKELATLRTNMMDDTAGKAAAEELPSLVRGIVKGGVQSAGLTGAAVGYVADAVGNKEWKEWGLQFNDDASRIANQLTLSKAASDIESADDLQLWLGENLGYVAYQAAEAIASGGLGSAAGKTVGKEAIGEAVAMGANNLRQTLGSVYSDAVEESKQTGKPMPSLLQIAAGAVGSAAIDTVADKMGMDAVTKSAYSGNILTRMSKSLGANMSIQGGTEALQLIPEDAGAGKDPFREGWGKRMFDEGAVGALGGAGPGIVGGINKAADTRLTPVSQRPTPTDILQTPDIDPAISAFNAATKAGAEWQALGITNPQDDLAIQKAESQAESILQGSSNFQTVLEANRIGSQWQDVKPIGDPSYESSELPVAEPTQITSYGNNDGVQSLPATGSGTGGIDTAAGVGLGVDAGNGLGADATGLPTDNVGESSELPTEIPAATVAYNTSPQKSAVKELPYDFTVQNNGSVIVNGDAAEILAAFPGDVRAQKVKGGVRFGATRAADIVSALGGVYEAHTDPVKEADIIAGSDELGVATSSADKITAGLSAVELGLNEPIDDGKGGFITPAPVAIRQTARPTGVANAVAEYLGKAFGRDVVWFQDENKTDRDPNGFFHEDAVYLNAKSNRPVFTVVMHEIMHGLPTEIKTALIDAVSKTTDAKTQGAFIKTFKMHGAESSLVTEEMVAHLSQRVFETPEGWSQLRSKLGDQKFLKVVTHVAEGLTKVMELAKKGRVAEFTTDVAAVYDAVTTAFADMQNTPRVEKRSDGTVRIYGDSAAVRKSLKAGGINSFAASNKGYTDVGKSQSAQAEQLFSQPKFSAKEDYADIADEEISKRGINPEDAYPDINYEPTSPKSKNKQGTFKIAGEEAYADYHENGDPNDEKLGELVTKHSKLNGPAGANDFGKRTEKFKKDWNRRIAASADLFRRGFDFHKSVGDEASKRIAATWKKIAKTEGAFEFGNPDWAMGMTPTAKAHDIAQQMLRGTQYTAKITGPSHDMVVQLTDTRKGIRSEAHMEYDPMRRTIVMHTAGLQKDSGLGKPAYQIGQKVAAELKADIIPDFLILGVNSYRRTEQMFSGTLRNEKGVMQPAAAQRVYGWEKGGNEDQNLTRTALASTRNAIEAVPEIQQFTYDLATDKFYYKGKEQTKLNNEIAESALKGILNDGDVRALGVSRSTLARASVTLQAIDGEVQVPEKIAKPPLYSAKEEAGPRVNFEIAPDPNNEKLANAWRGLSEDRKLSISKEIAEETLPEALDIAGAKGRLTDQVGSYLDDTNPSFALVVESGDIDKVSKLLGHVYQQDSMMNIGANPFNGSDSVGAVHIDLGEKTPQEIKRIYDTIRAQAPEVGGQSYADGQMILLNYSDTPLDELTDKIDRSLHSEYDVYGEQVHASFPEKKDYGYDSTQTNTGEQGETGEGTRQRVDSLRREASRLIEAKLKSAGVKLSAKESAHSGTAHLEVPTRYPTGKKFTGNVRTDRLLSDFTAAQEDPVYFKKIADAVAGFTGLRGATPSETAELNIEFFKRNLLDIYDRAMKVSPKAFEMATHWYPGGNKISGEFGDSWGKPKEAAAGMIAALSPSMDWFVNVNTAKKLGDVLTFHKDTSWSPKMDEIGRAFAAEDASYAPILNGITGKKLSDLTRPDHRAAWFDLYDRSHMESRYRMISPDGEFLGMATNADGSESKALRQSIANLAKAVSIYDNPSIDNISDQVGFGHKVRNFYNNIIAPDSANNHTTIDTHAVGAAHMMAVSNKSPEVNVNFSGPGSSNLGLSGTYPLYHEAYVRAAAARKVMPRAMQSITWEAVRTLFDKKSNVADKKQVVAKGEKKATYADRIRDIWENWKQGDINEQQARDQVNDLLGGIREPEWFRSSIGGDEAGRSAADSTELSGDLLPRSEDDAGATRPRAKSRASKGAAQFSAKEQVDTPDIRYSQKEDPIWKSALTEGVNSLSYKSLTGPMWGDALKSLVNKGKVKQDEIEWSGINDFLKMQEGKVTKEQVLQFLDGNGVQVTETTLGDATNNERDLNDALYGTGVRAEYGFDGDQVYFYDEEGEDLDYNDLPAEIQAIADEHNLTARQPSKYGPDMHPNLTLPGGENYREVLLTLPGMESDLRRLDKEQWRSDTLLENLERQGVPEDSKRWTDAVDENDKIRKERNAAYIKANKPEYKSFHWDAPNVLAHIRINDRTDADGNKVLFVEEIQSDWGQEGKKRGFDTPAGQLAPGNTIKEETGSNGRVSWVVRSQSGESIGFGDTREEAIADAPRKGIPLAPFVTKTEGWLNLALKRVIKMAVDGGYDKVAFTNGEQNADRYSLAKQVDEIHILKDGDKYDLGFKINGSYSNGAGEKGIGLDRIEQLIGKEMAERISKQPEGRSYLSGDDLKVGGEGMKTFYDSIVPNATKALLKKFGGGQMEVVSLRNQAEDFDDLDNATDEEMQQLENGGVGLEQPGFTVTDKMRESASGGMPMFSRKEIVGQTDRQYTPDQLAAFDSVGFRVDTPSIRERAAALQRDAGKKMAQGIADQFMPVAEFDRKAYILMRLSKGASGAFEALLQGGKLKLTDNVYDFDAEQRGGVVEKLLMPMHGEHHDFMRWVAANRAEQLMAEGRENLFTQDAIDKLKTLATGNAKFDYTIQHGVKRGKVTRDRAEIYADSLKTFTEFNKNVMDMAEQSGLIDPESREIWEKDIYVPFYRVSEEDEFSGSRVKNGVVRQQAFKELKGGTDKLNSDLLDNTLMNWAHLLEASAKNRAALATLDAAVDMGIAVQAGESTARSMGKSIKNDRGVVWVMDGGQKKFYLVDDPYVLTALTSLEYAGMRGPIMDAMTNMKHWLTVGVTASPHFKVKNLVRDSTQAVAVSGLSGNIVGNVVRGYQLSNRSRDEHFRLLAGGGTIHFGTMYEGSEAKRVQALVESGVKDFTILNDPIKVKAFYRKAVEPVITAYNELGNRGEEINRASLYDQLIKQGVSHAEASFQARDLMDFSMQGTFTTVRFLTQVVPFMNARIQGMYKLGRGAKEDPAKFSAVLGAVTLMSLALLAAYRDDEDWKEREEWDRNNFWWFKVGSTAYRIPKPFEIGAIATLAERGMERFIDAEMTNERLAKQAWTLLMDNLSMNPVPQIVKPIIDIYSNKDSFSGRPIENMSMQRLDPEYRFNQGTTMAARGISTAMSKVVGTHGLSPLQIDHIFRGYFGWLGAFITSGADWIARPLTDQPSRPTPDYWKVATGGMVADKDSGQSRYVSQMYEQAKELELAYATHRDLKKKGKTEEAREYAEEHKDELRRYKRVENVKQDVAKMNERIRVIERSNKTPQEKRDLIRAIKEKENKAAKTLAR